MQIKIAELYLHLFIKPKLQKLNIEESFYLRPTACPEVDRDSINNIYNEFIQVFNPN